MTDVHKVVAGKLRSAADALKVDASRQVEWSVHNKLKAEAKRIIERADELDPPQAPVEEPTGDVVVARGGWFFKPGGDLGWVRDDLKPFDWAGVQGHTGDAAIYRREPAPSPAEAVEAAEAVSPALMMEEFNRRGGVDVSRPARPTVAVDGAIQRVEFVEEEAQEFREAIEAGDLVKTADALGDLAYAVYGAAWRFGIDLDAVIAEVHRSNMTKTASAGDGKAIKGAGYSAPNFARILGLPEPSPVQVEVERCAYCGDEIDDATGTWRSLGDFGGTGTGGLVERFWCADAPDHKHSPLPAPAEDDPIEALARVRVFLQTWDKGDQVASCVSHRDGTHRLLYSDLARVLEVGGQQPGVPVEKVRGVADLLRALQEKSNDRTQWCYKTAADSVAALLPEEPTS